MKGTKEHIFYSLKLQLWKMLGFYGRWVPLNRGKGKLFEVLSYMTGGPPPNFILHTQDGRKFKADLNEGTYRKLFLKYGGCHEPNETTLMCDIIRQRDCIFDVGANMGWYTTLFSKLTSPTGKVYAFEPVPPVFHELKQNIAINKSEAELLPCAVGERDGCVAIHLFSNLPHQYASISSCGHKVPKTFMVEQISLGREEK